MNRIDRWAVATALSALPVRLALAVATDLSPDEAYYLAAARTGWWPPDHPPLAILLARLGDALPALPLELRIRVVPLVLGALTAILLVAAVALRGAPPAAQRWTALLSTWTLLPMAGGFLATPDAPAVCALAALLLLHSHPVSRASRLGAFAVAFVGLTSKVVLIPLLLLYLVIPWRNNPWRLPMVAALVCSVAAVAPSLVFQSDHAFRPDSWSMLAATGGLVAVVAAQLALWTPAPWLDGLRGLAAAPLIERAWVAALLALVAVSTLVRAIPAEPNWLAPAALVLIVAAAARTHAHSRKVRTALVLLGPALTLVAVSHVLHPWLPLTRQADPSARLHGWRGAAPPDQAPGVGPYAVAAERCVYRGDCSEIVIYFEALTLVSQVH